uniref:Uncharacterized protein n=1 Tax=Oryza brachyantha TaxID=4533 RepID=J3MF27_ORYBR
HESIVDFVVKYITRCFTILFSFNIQLALAPGEVVSGEPQAHHFFSWPRLLS